MSRGRLIRAPRQLRRGALREACRLELLGHHLSEHESWKHERRNVVERSEIVG